MTTALASPQPALVEEVATETLEATPPTSKWNIPAIAVHPQAAEIVRQIDHYFSEDNLRQDAHLLGLFKEGNGTVSLNEVLGFRKMRKFKPKSAVKEAVKLSTVVEVVEGLGKKARLRRRKALRKSITVTPKVSEDRKRLVVPEDKPWLTKGMLKPTGLEEFATCGPIAPKEFEEDCREYDPDNCFTERIETAIRKYIVRRKWHQVPRLIFEKYMIYGGMECGAGQFTGGIDDRQRDEMTRKEIAEATSHYYVSERVLDGFLEADSNEAPTYIVDFEATAKGFLSTEFPAICNWYDNNQVMIATNVLRNFYNYLLLHDVCPEYNHQLHAARKVCDLAEAELLKLAIVDRYLPGGFNIACSTLTGGNYANLNAPNGEWVVEGDDLGWTEGEAKMIFLAAIFAHGTEEQMKAVENMNGPGEDFSTVLNVVREEEGMGLEVVSIEPTVGAACKVYEDVRLNGTIIKPMGKLRCKRWKVPHRKLDDFPAWVLQEQRRNEEDDLEFLLEDEALKYCYPGMKIEACVKELNIGIKFIDYYDKVYVSFFTWLWNESIRDYKEPGRPLAWMEKANAKERGFAGGEAMNVGDEQEVADDDDNGNDTPN